MTARMPSRIARVIGPLVESLAATSTRSTEVARSFGETVASKVQKSSREIAELAGELSEFSRSQLSEQMQAAKLRARKGRARLRVSAAAASGVAGGAYSRGKRAAAHPRTRQVAALVATIALTSAIKKHPAGVLASSALSMLEAISQADKFRNGSSSLPRWQVELARFVGTHTWKRIGQTGSLACFTYVDANGVVTERMVRNWRGTGRLIRGHCLLRQQVRSFRIDRIQGWSEPE